MMGAGSHIHVVTWRICTPKDGHAVCLVSNSFFPPLTGDVLCIHPSSDRWSLPRCNAALLSCQTRHSESPHSTGLRRRRQRSFARRRHQRTTLLEHKLCLACHASSPCPPWVCTIINTAWVESSDDSVRNSPVLLLTQQATHIPTQRYCTLFVFRPHAPYRVVPSRPLLARSPPPRRPRVTPSASILAVQLCTGRIAAGVWS